MIFTTEQINGLKSYGYSIGSKAHLYRKYGATNEQIKRFVEHSTPIDIDKIDWLKDIYMTYARIGFSEDRGNKFNNPVYDLMKTAMKGTVEKWNNGEYHTFRKL